MVDVEKIIKTTVKKGKVKLGARETKVAIANGSAKLVIMANNCPFSSEINTLANKKKIPVYAYASNSMDLGYLGGKPFAVSVFAMIEDGGSNILQLVKKRA